MANSRERLENRPLQLGNLPTRPAPATTSVDTTLLSELESLITPEPVSKISKFDRIRAGAVTNLRRLLNTTLSGDTPDRQLSLGQIEEIGQLVQVDEFASL